jgi:hypothetical protein
MSDDWHQTEQIVMAVQTAELRQAGVSDTPELHLSCNLVSIARGQCQLTVSAYDTPVGEQIVGEKIGSLLIEVNRPVMRGDVQVPNTLFAAIRERLAATPPRPISLTLCLDTKLAVSIEGDLRIDAEKTIGIQDMAVSLPLK